MNGEGAACVWGGDRVRVALESTSKVVTVNGMPARVWEGQTEGGVPCFAFVTRIAPAVEDPPPEVCAEFERDLIGAPPPRLDLVAAIPSRLVL